MRGHVPLSSTRSCLSKNSASLRDTSAQAAHWRTGSTKHMRGSATFWPQHLSQKHFPQRRQWCWGGGRAVSGPHGPTGAHRAAPHWLRAGHPRESGCPEPLPPTASAHLSGEKVKLGVTLHAPGALGERGGQSPLRTRPCSQHPGGSEAGLPEGAAAPARQGLRKVSCRTRSPPQPRTRGQA